MKDFVEIIRPFGKIYDTYVQYKKESGSAISWRDWLTADDDYLPTEHECKDASEFMDNYK